MRELPVEMKVVAGHYFGCEASLEYATNDGAVECNGAIHRDGGLLLGIDDIPGEVLSAFGASRAVGRV
jgi:hypothetical protein